MDVNKIGLSTQLTRALATTDSKVYIKSTDWPALIPTDGTHYYATIYKSGTQREHVLVRGIADGGLLVDRGQDGTVPLNFPYGSCLKVEWNPAQLTEYIEQSGIPTTFASPGVYCLDCTSCLTIDAQGRITNVDGVDKC